MHTRIKQCTCLWHIYTHNFHLNMHVMSHTSMYIFDSLCDMISYTIFLCQWEIAYFIFKWTRNMGPVLCHRNNTENNSKIVSYPLISKWQKSINLQWIFCYLFQVNLKIHAYFIHNWITLLSNFNFLHPPKWVVRSLDRIVPSLGFNCSLYSCL